MRYLIVLPTVLVLSGLGSGSDAATQMFEVDLWGLSGDSELLSNLNILENSNGTVRFAVDFSEKPSLTAIAGTHNLRKYRYDSVQFTAGSSTIDLAPSDGNIDRVHIRDAKAENMADQFQIYSHGPDPSQYSYFGLIAYENDETAYSFGDAVTDQLLNSFEGFKFYLGREIDGINYEISTTTLTFRDVTPKVQLSRLADVQSDVPAVPVPGGLPLILTALGGLFAARRSLGVKT